MELSTVVSSLQQTYTMPHPMLFILFSKNSEIVDYWHV